MVRESLKLHMMVSTPPTSMAATYYGLLPWWTFRLLGRWSLCPVDNAWLYSAIMVVDNSDIGHGDFERIACIVFLTITPLFLIARFLSRILSKQLGSDDWAALAAFVSDRKSVWRLLSGWPFSNSRSLLWIAIVWLLLVILLPIKYN